MGVFTVSPFHRFAASLQFYPSVKNRACLSALSLASIFSMPLDPYFTSNGRKDFTCLGHRRTIFTEKEKQAADEFLKLPEGEQAQINDEIGERLKARKQVSRVEKCFHELMCRRYRVRRFRALRLTRREDEPQHAHA
jgi:hypothetical protein